MIPGPLVALTGATGFLGQHIFQALRDRGVRVRVLVRHGFDGDAELVHGDVRDQAACEALVTGTGAVIHAAGLIKALDSSAFDAVNRGGAATLAAAARAAVPAARFVLISSLAARSPALSAYAASKAAAEDAARAAYAGAPARLVVLRPTAVYGPGDRESLAMFRAARRPVAPRFGSGRLTFVYAADVAAAAVAAAAGDLEGCRAITDPEPDGYTLASVLAEAARAVGRAPPRLVPVPDAVLLATGHAAGAWSQLCRRPGIFGAGKAREMLQDWRVGPDDQVWTGKTKLREGFATTAAWYRAKNWL